MNNSHEAALEAAVDFYHSMRVHYTHHAAFGLAVPYLARKLRNDNFDVLEDLLRTALSSNTR